MNIAIIIAVACYLTIVITRVIQLYPNRYQLNSEFKKDVQSIKYYFTHPKSIVRDF